PARRARPAATARARRGWPTRSRSTLRDHADGVRHDGLVEPELRDRIDHLAAVRLERAAIDLRTAEIFHGLGNHLVEHQLARIDEVIGVADVLVRIAADADD